MYVRNTDNQNKLFPTLIYTRLSTLTPRNSGNWRRHFSKKAAIVSPFLHWQRKVRQFVASAVNPTHCHSFSVSTSIPVGVSDLDVFLLRLLLLGKPFKSKPFSFSALSLFTVSVWQERRVDVRVLLELTPFHRRLIAVSVGREFYVVGRIALGFFVVVESKGKRRTCRLLALLGFLCLLSKQILHVRLATSPSKEICLSRQKSDKTYFSSLLLAASRAFCSSNSFRRCWNSSKWTKPTVLFFNVSSTESFCPTKRFADGRAFSVSLMRICFCRSNSSRILVRSFTSTSSRLPSALLVDIVDEILVSVTEVRELCRTFNCLNLVGLPKRPSIPSSTTSPTLDGARFGYKPPRQLCREGKDLSLCLALSNFFPVCVN